MKHAMTNRRNYCQLWRRLICVGLFFLSPFSFLLLPAQEVASSPCPEVLINEKYDHVPLSDYRQYGWDTTITCSDRIIELSSEPYIPVQYFNGTYIVEQIPFNPPDTTFYLNYNPATDANNPYKKKLAINNDDDWAPSFINIAYPFYFFGIRKDHFLLGDNGIVTFANAAREQECPYAQTTPLPWATSVPSSPSCNPALMRDAIYGVYEDTYTGSGGSYMSGNQGIYYGVLDDYPCRKIIASWNQIPVFSNQNKRQTYQIVCYEGSNIIEVHVKQRKCCSSTNNGYGTIGIQNATGQPQQPSNNIDDPNHYVVSGSPAAFAAPGWNPKSATATGPDSNITNIAFRFTPQGTTQKSQKWYRIFDDPTRDSVVLTTNQNDTNGYYVPMGQVSTDHPTLTKAVVSPNCVSRYVCELRFMNANNDWYILRDTIKIGIDTTNTIDMNATVNGTAVPNTGDSVSHQHDICQGQTATINVTYGQQRLENVRWTVTRILNGVSRELPSSMYTQNGGPQLILRPDPQADTLPRNKIDTILVQAEVFFRSGCQNWMRSMMRVFPNFDTVVPDGICAGQTYTWHPCDSITRTFSSNTNPDNVFVTLKSRPGCDSTVHLALTVFDVSLTYEDVTHCEAYTWRNGQTYSESNTATSPIDTVVLKNAYDCDSVVQLRFTLAPVTAKIKSSLAKFDFDHLDAELTDLSTGSDSRRWRFPTSADQTGPTAYYSIPVNLDEAEIWLTAYSPYGCADSTSIIIPFNKECFWVPNAFTPDDPAGNNIFSSVSIKTIYQEMFIYNRLGELVFQCEGADCGWDGKHMNGTPCPQGAYVYVIRYSNGYEPKIVKVKRGTVTLIR